MHIPSHYLLPAGVGSPSAVDSDDADRFTKWNEKKKEREKKKRSKWPAQCFECFSFFGSSDKKDRGPTIISSRSWCRFKLRILPPSPFQNRFPLIPKKRIISPLFCIKSFPKNLVAAHSNYFHDGSFFFLPLIPFSISHMLLFDLVFRRPYHGVRISLR